MSLKNYPVKKRKYTYWKRLDDFDLLFNTLFDIKGSNEIIISQEKLWNVKMTPDDIIFYENQRLNPPIGYCTSFVNRKWKIQNERKLQDKARREAAFEKANEHEESMNTVIIDECEEMSCEDTDDDFQDENNSYVYNSSLIDDENDDMPYRFRHIRNGPRSVRPEYYVLMHTLKPELHMSEAQAQGAIIGVSNILFGRKDFRDSNMPILAQSQFETQFGTQLGHNLGTQFFM